jgi:hypothetical protein
LIVAAVLGCGKNERAAGKATEAVAASPALAVPRTGGPIRIDGELDEPGWAAAARTGAFRDARGEPARPFSEARYLHDGEHLLLCLYAADDDIRARVTAHDGPVWIDDAFALRLTPRRPGAQTYLVDISARGVIMDARRGPGDTVDPSWESGIRVAVDRDGTLDDPSDEDEEWVVEAALPLRSLGIGPETPIDLEITRCDTPRGTQGRRCASARNTLSLR